MLLIDWEYGDYGVDVNDYEGFDFGGWEDENEEYTSDWLVDDEEERDFVL